MPLFADNNCTAISLNHKGGPRGGIPLYADMPQAFYDVKNQEIIIDGGGAVSYYDVEISSPVTNTVEISTQVNGTYDTFSISNDVLAGKSIDSIRTIGDVVIKEGIEYEIEAKGTVRLEDGFKVEKGAVFSVYPADF